MKYDKVIKHYLVYSQRFDTPKRILLSKFKRSNINNIRKSKKKLRHLILHISHSSNKQPEQAT